MPEETSNIDTTPLLKIHDNDDSENDSDHFQPAPDDVALLKTFTTSALLLGVILGTTFESLSWVSHIGLLSGTEQPVFWMDLGCTIYHLCLLPILVLECIRHVFGSLVSMVSPPGQVNVGLCDMLYLHIQSWFAIGILVGVLIALLIIDVCLNLRHHVCIVGGLVVALCLSGAAKQFVDETITLRLLSKRFRKDPEARVLLF